MRRDDVAAIRNHELGPLGGGQATPDTELLSGVDGVREAGAPDTAFGTDRAGNGQRGGPLLAAHVFVVEEDADLLALAGRLVPVAHARHPGSKSSYDIPFGRAMPVFR